LRGARPVFVDIDPDTLVIDHRLIAEKITARTKAIVPINYGGVSPELDEINALAKARGLMVIEDAAQGIGAKYKGRYVGSITPISVFSFHETKNISCGEGGALLLNDPSLEQAATFAQEKGTDRSLVIAGIQSKYSWVSLGSSYLLSDILAAMLYEQLNARNTIAELRRIAFEGYQRLFKKYEDEGRVRTQRIPESCETNYHGYTLVFPDGDERDRFIAFMKEHKIMCYIGYLALHSSRMGREVCRSADQLPVTEYTESRIVRLPVHSGITKEHSEYFAEKARQFFDGGAS
jgi:dTDP-4-amino-4,6-dideoxygalactose transaminase